MQPGVHDHNDTKILIVDIETTWFLNQGGSIVEVGIVLLNLVTGEKKTVFDQVVREDIFSDEHTTGKYGWIFKNSDLTPEQVRNGMPRAEAAKEIQDLIDNFPLGITAFNKKFDLDFLRSRGIQIHKELPCPMIELTNVLKLPGNRGYKRPKVQEARDMMIGEDYVEAHRGADDAYHEADIFYQGFLAGWIQVPDYRIMLERIKIGVMKDIAKFAEQGDADEVDLLKHDKEAIEKAILFPKEVQEWHRDALILKISNRWQQTKGISYPQ